MSVDNASEMWALSSEEIMPGTANGFFILRWKNFHPIGIKYDCFFLFERFAREYKIQMSVVRGATLAFSPLNAGGRILKRVFKLALLMSVWAIASDFFRKEFQTSVGTPSVRALVYPIILIGTASTLYCMSSLSCWALSKISSPQKSPTMETNRIRKGRLKRKLTPSWCIVLRLRVQVYAYSSRTSVSEQRWNSWFFKNIQLRKIMVLSVRINNNSLRLDQ